MKPLAMVMAPPPMPLVPTGTEAILFMALWMTGIWRLGKTRGHGAALRFGNYYLLIIALLYIIVPQNYTPTQQWLSDHVTHAAATVIGTIVGADRIDGTVMETELGPWEMAPGCLGIIYSTIAIIAFLLWPSPWRIRLAWSGAAFLTLQILNFARIVGMYHLWYYEKYSITDTLHRGTGVFFGLVFFAFWAFMISRMRPGSSVACSEPVELPRVESS